MITSCPHSCPHSSSLKLLYNAYLTNGFVISISLIIATICSQFPHESPMECLLYTESGRSGESKNR